MRGEFLDDGDDSARPSSLAVGSIFRKARHAQRLSQAQVAALTRGRPGQISRAMVSLIERGHHLPGLEATVALSRALNVEPMEIFEQVDLDPVTLDDLPERDLEVLRKKALDLSWTGEHRKALALCETMLRLLELEPPADRQERARWEARIEIHRASALRHCGALAAARTAAERAVVAAEDLPELQARAYIMLASLLERRGLRPLARDIAARAIELASGRGPLIEGLAWMEMGSILEAWCKYEEAHQAFVRAGKLIREAGDRRHEVHVEGNLGACLVGLGRHAHARQRYIRAVELARRYDVPASEAFWLVELGKLGLDDGRLEEADRCAEAALRIARPLGIGLTVFRAECLRHRLRVSHGDPGGDRQRLARLRRLYSALQDHVGVEEVEWFRSNVLEDARDEGKRP